MKKTICLFFSNNTSLLTWKKSGILERETNYYKDLIKKKYNFIFLTYGDKKDTQINFPHKKNIKIIPIYKKIKKPKNFFIRNLYNLILPSIILRKENFNYIKANQLSAGFSGLFASIILRKKIYYRIGWEPNILFKHLNKNFKIKILYKILSFIIYNFGQKFLVSSNEIKKFILGKILINKKSKKIIVLENFVDTNVFLRIKKKKFKNRILLVSRLEKEKNIKFLIESLESTNIAADIIGEGTEKDNLKKFAKQKNVKIKFLGRKKNNHLPYFYNKYHVYVICSKNEGNVKSLLEAMACQMICVGTNVNGIKNIIQNNKTGLIVNNPLELKTSLLKIFKNLNKFKFLGKLARNRILKFNSINHFLDEEIRIIQSL